MAKVRFINIALTVFMLVNLLGICKAEHRSKRNLFELATLLECTSGKSLEYVGYGCYCGYGNKGGISPSPIDDVDTCCMHHDKCYDEAENKKHCGDKITELMSKPLWSKYNFGKNCRQKEVSCFDAPGSCERLACDCDRDFALCVAEAEFKIENTRKRLDSRKCES